MNRVYLIAAKSKEMIIDNDDTVYKIGVTKQDGDKRLKQLNTGNDKKLEIVKEFQSEYAYKIERTLHKFFENKRISREWFSLSIEEIERFIPMCKKFEESFKHLQTNIYLT